MPVGLLRLSERLLRVEGCGVRQIHLDDFEPSQVHDLGRRTLGLTLAIGLIASGGVLASPHMPSAAAATQEIYYVSPGGSDSNSGLSSGSAFATIDRARSDPGGGVRPPLPPPELVVRESTAWAPPR